MRTKLLELRDRGTTIPLLCIEMSPEDTGYGALTEETYCKLYGYPLDGKKSISICHFAMPSGGRITNDPYDWFDRTYRVAHDYIIEHWNELLDGEVVDVEYILGETPEKKQSEIL